MMENQDEQIIVDDREETETAMENHLEDTPMTSIEEENEASSNPEISWVKLLEQHERCGPALAAVQRSWELAKELGEIQIPSQEEDDIDAMEKWLIEHGEDDSFFFLKFINLIMHEVLPLSRETLHAIGDKLYELRDLFPLAIETGTIPTATDFEIVDNDPDIQEYFRQLRNLLSKAPTYHSIPPIPQACNSYDEEDTTGISNTSSSQQRSPPAIDAKGTPGVAPTPYVERLDDENESNGFAMEVDNPSESPNSSQSSPLSTRQSPTPEPSPSPSPPVEPSLRQTIEYSPSSVVEEPPNTIALIFSCKNLVPFRIRVDPALITLRNLTTQFRRSRSITRTTQVVIMYRGRALMGNRTVADAGLRNGDILHVKVDWDDS